MIIDIVTFAVLAVVAMGMAAILLFACVVSVEESKARREAWKAGTHDYYGNRIEEVE